MQSEEKIERMIASIINNRHIEEIEKIAALEDGSDLSFAARYLLACCDDEHPEKVREIARIATGISEYAIFEKPIYDLPDPHNQMGWGKLAEIAEWGYWTTIFDVIALNYTPNFAQAHLRSSLVAWAWCWTSYQNNDSLEAAQEGRLTQRLLHCPNNSVGWAIAEGLLLAIKWGWVVPENPEEFLLDYCRWTGYGNHEVIGHPLSSLNLDREDLSEELLQALAVFWDLAATELGKRHVKLAMPLVQSKSFWTQGVEYSIPKDRTFEEDVERFLQGGTLEKYILFDRYCHSTSKSPRVQNPNDPFGEPVSLFELKIGVHEYPSRPTYEDAIAYINAIAHEALI
jgi:hypothetical protein